MKTTETQRLILYGIKHIIEREKWNQDMRNALDKDLCDKIANHFAPTTQEEECSDGLPKECVFSGRDEE